MGAGARRRQLPVGGTVKSGVCGAYDPDGCSTNPVERGEGTSPDIRSERTTCAENPELPSSCALSDQLCNVALRRRSLFHPEPGLTAACPRAST